ncbi:shikimate dehydrogenase [Variibacter gotjawalensis]|uniref:Shikimate dehydrogenase (NADP(+)) n=1 Tax=Variibacter gotjawalensis TaxID=1333996 RepID=A0A0S3PR58_9BRAD|nr:shikimate dehydrogenase [Variibacter gotjawalensis]NIK48669.1 shikimate dehydrogenase [Variibacter gotjawalensis]RZS50530.1 shikimate dehydrogenase [Variibacter gotjawalensis]BAT58365.1 shikimate dehydrogenase [Variibacter gotjawalensis]
MGTSQKAACVIGWPIKHSRSPLIHKYWMRQHGIDADYRREAVEPEKLGDFIAHLSSNGYVGANVTLPHKEAVLQLADPDSRALSVGAANTLFFRSGRLCATNTDVEGFVANLDVEASGWDSELETAVVLGAGGGARAVIYGLIERKVERIVLVNRTIEKAAKLASVFGDRVQPTAWSDLPRAMRSARLLVNTTSLGMTGQPPLEIDLAPLASDAAVSDIVYSPLETPLLAAAKARGLKTADGLGMLLYQAVRGFSLWFGVKPEVTAELRALVERDLVN